MLSNRLLILMSVITVSISFASAAESWSAFRGPEGDGVTARPLPVEWGPEKNIAWRTEIPGEGWSSPVTTGERIYLTAAIPSGDEENRRFTLSLLILDAESGEIVKTVPVMEQTDERPARIHKKNSHASPTPISHDGKIYVHFGYQGTACLSLDGDILWTNRDLYFKPTHGNGGSPVLTAGHLIFTCDGDAEPKIVALNAATGELAWSTPRPVSAKKTFSFCTPTVIEVDGRVQVLHLVATAYWHWIRPRERLSGMFATSAILWCPSPAMTVVWYSFQRVLTAAKCWRFDPPAKAW